MHFLFQLTWFCLIMCIRHARTASNGLSSLYLHKQRENMLEDRNSQRATVSSVDESELSEVQHDIVMYWTEVFLGGVDINLILQGSRTERVRLQQITRRPAIRNVLRARTMVYRVMIKPVPELKSVVISSSEALPRFEKILIVKNNDMVYDFPLNQSSIGTISNRTIALAREYPAVSIRFTGNGLCVNPVNSDLPPPIVTRLVLRYNCGTLDTFFTITRTKNLQHIASGLFVGDMTGMANQGITAANYELSQVHVRLGVQGLGSQAQSGNLGSQAQPVELGSQKQSENLGSQSQQTEGTGIQSQPVRTGGQDPSVDLGSQSQSTEGISGQSRPVNTGNQKSLEGLGVQKTSGDLGGQSQSTESTSSQSRPVKTGDQTPSIDLGRDSRPISTETESNLGNLQQVNIHGRDSKKLVSNGRYGDSRLFGTDSHLIGNAGSEIIRNHYSKKPTITGDGGKIKQSSAFGDVVGGDSKPSSIDDDGDVTNRKPASLGNRPDIFKNQHDDGELGNTGNIDNEKKIMDDEDVAMDEAPHISNKIYPKQKLSLGQYPGFKDHPQYNAHSQSQPVVAHPLSTDDEKRSDITMRSTLTQGPQEHVKLWLKPNSNFKFQLTSNPTKTGIAQTTNVRDSILPYHASNVNKLNGSINEEQFKRDHVINGKTVLNRRALVPKSYLQESETGMCIGFQNMQVVLMPCESVSSSVQFYGKSKSPAAPAAQKPAPPSTPVVSTCGSSCPSTCAPSCAQSCCSSAYTSPQTSGSCGGECPSSCYPSCTSSCCGTGSQSSQGMSSSLSTSCPSSCSSAQTCPSSQCPQSCCSGGERSSTTLNQGGYSMSQGQTGSSMPQGQTGYSMPQGEAGYPMSQGLSMSQNQQCPSGCKKDCRPSCPFSCC